MKTRFDQSVYKSRREELAKYVEDGAVIIPSHPEAVRNSDVPHLFRARSSIVYFTGFEEPGTIFVFRPGRDPEYVLFVPPKDELHELWDGFRYGEEGAKASFKCDAAYSLEDFEKELPNLLGPVDSLYYKFLDNSNVDEVVLKIQESIKRSRGRTGLGSLPILDPTEIIGEIRLLKTREETSSLSKAGKISAEAHKEVMKAIKPGMSEKQVEGILDFMFKSKGSNRVGYTPIVASGDNANTLHYKSNNDICVDGDLLLVDAGTEWAYYTADITRTFPVNGKFTEAQKEVYNAVLKAQKAAIDKAKPGNTFADLQETAVDSICESLYELGVFSEEPKEIKEKQLYRKYYPHNIGHWIGLDVHDRGPYFVDGGSRKLEEGICLTIEPGLYFPKSDEAIPEKYKGIGVRIEDNILVTAVSNENLTADVPKEVEEIETLMEEGSNLDSFF